jgi:hypothetical protein
VDSGGGGPAGRVGLVIDLAGLFAPGPPAALAGLVASYAVRAAGQARDDGPAGEAGAIGRAARAAAALSARVPVVVAFDDADRLDPGLARALIRGLAGRAHLVDSNLDITCGWREWFQSR